MQAPIHSIKHYVQFSTAAIASGANSSHVVVDAVSTAAAGSNSRDVEEGSLVKAIFFEMWMGGNGAVGSNNQFTLIVEKKPAGATVITVAQMANLASYPNKKNILYTTQGIVGSISGGPAIPIIRTFILIPKGKQRMGLGDQMILTISNVSAETLQRCGFMTYKEYN